MKVFTFIKEEVFRWYIDLPEWTGDKADLEMVMGADMMLDIYAQDNQKVDLMLSQEVPAGEYDTLVLIEVCSTVTGGAFYQVNSIGGINYDFKAWLCDVTTFVFGEFPEKIYIQNCTI